MKDPSGKDVYKLEGKWNEFYTMTNVATGESKEIWRANEKPELWDHQYYFSKFALQMNFLP